MNNQEILDNLIIKQKKIDEEHTKIWEEKDSCQNEINIVKYNIAKENKLFNDLKWKVSKDLNNLESYDEDDSKLCALLQEDFHHHINYTPKQDGLQNIYFSDSDIYLVFETKEDMSLFLKTHNIKIEVSSYVQKVLDLKAQITVLDKFIKDINEINT